jgi:methyl-accepting chemotaxis protein
MKLGTKILVGFGALLGMCALLGGVAVWRMGEVKKGTSVLAQESMPAAAVANQVEREFARMMYEMRGYSFSEETNYLALARTSMAQLTKSLESARDLSGKPGVQSLGALKEAVERASAKAAEYERLSQDTVALITGISRDRQAMDEAAQAYMKQADDFLDVQNETLKEHLRTNQTASISVLEDRVRKINLVYDVLMLGQEIRIGNFKAQSTRNLTHLQEAQKKFEQVNQKLDELKGITRQESNLKQIAECRAAGQRYSEAMESLLKHWQERDQINQRRVVVGDAVLRDAQQTAGSTMDSSAKTSLEAASMLAGASRVVVIGLILALAAGIALAVLITRSITRPIRHVADQLSTGAEQTVNAADQVSSSSQSLAEGASEQAASLEETSSSLEEMASMTQRNAENTQRANQLAKEARLAAERGAGDMKTMSTAMDAIKASSDEIAKIIKTIDEIAFQTNLLALNAAVEAARAGEAGMGFAVVAEEVRSLAQRSAVAAKETSQKIEGAIQKSALGVEVSARVASALNDIVTKVRQVDEIASEVASASREQGQGIGQINTAVSQMDKVTQANAASAEESAAAAEELNAQAQSMKDAVVDLLHLVDGQEANRKVTAPEKPASRSAGYTAKTNAPVQSNRQNGHSTRVGTATAKPVVISSPRRSASELEDSFKEM